MLFVGDWYFNEDYQKFAGFKAAEKPASQAKNNDSAVVEIQGDQPRLDKDLENFAKNYRFFYRYLG